MSVRNLNLEDVFLTLTQSTLIAFGLIISATTVSLVNIYQLNLVLWVILLLKRHVLTNKKNYVLL